MWRSCVRINHGKESWTTVVCLCIGMYFRAHLGPGVKFRIPFVSLGNVVPRFQWKLDFVSKYVFSCLMNKILWVITVAVQLDFFAFCKT